jgi:hypothetical protein
MCWQEGFQRAISRLLPVCELCVNAAVSAVSMTLFDDAPWQHCE